MSGSAIVALLTHARDVPVAERAGFAARVRDAADPRSLVLETCHRVEAYVVDTDDDRAPVQASVLPHGGRILRGEPAVRHAITVAAGHDSVVLGEDQVLHQLRDALTRARAEGGIDPTVERLVGVALRAGRQARSWQQGPRRSLADVALDAIAGRCGSLKGRAVLVVGAGEMGRLAVRAARRAGARVAIANRSAERAIALAAATDATAVPFDPGTTGARFAGVIVAIRGQWTVGAATIEALRTGDALIVDLSAPPAVPTALAAALGERLVTVDGLARAGERPGRSAAEDRPSGRVDALIETTVAEFLDWLAGHDNRAAAGSLVRQADRARESELADLWRRLPDLDPATRDAIDGMTRHLAARLLREPLERLGRDPDGKDGRVVRELFAL
jgi:glutamyl-tRNA reductase